MSIFNTLAPTLDLKHVIAYLVLILIIYIAGSTWKTWYLLRQFSGPPLAWLSSFYMAKTMLTFESHFRFYEVSKKYGDLARIGPKDLLTSDPEVVLYMGKVRSGYRKSDYYDGLQLDPRARTIVSETNDVRHEKLRAMMVGGYTGKEVVGLESRVDQRIRDLIASIEKKYLSSGSEPRRADFARLAQYLTLDVVTDLAYGEPFGYLEKDEDLHDFTKTIQESMPVMGFLSVIPWLARILMSPFVRSLTGPFPTDEKGLGKIFGLAKKVVAERFGPKKIERQDMLGSFIKNGLTQVEAEVEVVTQIVAGSDTTATAIRMTLLYIISNPDIKKRLLAEIATYLHSHPECHSTDSIISTTSARKELPYLQSCIREGLRIFPPFTGIASKQVPSKGDYINGRFVPGGTRIAISVWAVQRDEKVYGENTEVYMPERWMDAAHDEGKTRKMINTVESIFGVGRYGCLGRGIAFMELEKVLFEMFRRFDFVLLDPLKPVQSSNMMFFAQSGMYMRISRKEEGE